MLLMWQARDLHALGEINSKYRQALSYKYMDLKFN